MLTFFFVNHLTSYNFINFIHEVTCVTFVSLVEYLYSNRQLPTTATGATQVGATQATGVGAARGGQRPAISLTTSQRKARAVMAARIAAELAGHTLSIETPTAVQAVRGADVPPPPLVTPMTAEEKAAANRVLEDLRRLHNMKNIQSTCELAFTFGSLVQFCARALYLMLVALLFERFAPPSIQDDELFLGESVHVLRCILSRTSF